MMRIGAGLFLLAHAVITAAIWVPEQRGKDLKGFGSQANWLFAGSRPAVIAVAAVASACLAIAGVGVLAHHSWWAPAGLLGAGASAALIVATFTPWWTAAILINGVIGYAAWSEIAGGAVGGTP
jgi:hypothetical protein